MTTRTAGNANKISAELGFADFADLIKQSDRFIGAVCRKFSNSGMVMFEDMQQSCYMKLAIKLETFQGNAKFTTWLTSVCRNVCIDMLGEAKRKGRLDGLLSFESELFSDSSGDHEELGSDSGHMSKHFPTSTDSPEAILVAAQSFELIIRERRRLSRGRPLGHLVLLLETDGHHFLEEMLETNNEGLVDNSAEFIAGVLLMTAPKLTAKEERTRLAEMTVALGGKGNKASFEVNSFHRLCADFDFDPDFGYGQIAELLGSSKRRACSLSSRACGVIAHGANLPDLGGTRVVVAGVMEEALEA